MPQLPRLTLPTSEGGHPALAEIADALRTYHRCCAEFEADAEEHSRARRHSGAARRVVSDTTLEDHRARALASLESVERALRRIEAAISAWEYGPRAGRGCTDAAAIAAIDALKASLETGRSALADMRRLLLTSSDYDSTVSTTETGAGGLRREGVRRRRRVRQI